MCGEEFDIELILMVFLSCYWVGEFYIIWEGCGEVNIFLNCFVFIVIIINLEYI